MKSHIKELKHSLLKPFYNLKIFLILALSSIFIIPIFWIYGYLIQNCNVENSKKKNLIKFENWSKTGLDGLITIIVSLLVYLPAGLILIFLDSPFFTFYVSPWSNFINLISQINVFQSIILFIVGLLVTYIFPSAILVFANEKKFSKAVNPQHFLKVAFRKAYALRWFVQSILLEIIALPSILFSWYVYGLFLGGNVPFYAWILTSIVGALFSVYGFIFSFTYLGQIYKK